jgi:hypothetical protein
VPRRLLTLAAGDVAALLLFAAVGRTNHGEGALPLEVLGTAAPFVLGALPWHCPRQAETETRSLLRR